MRLAASTIVALAITLASPASAYDNYNPNNCTAIIGGKTVKLEPTQNYQGRTFCDFASDGEVELVTIKLNGRYNFYNIKAKRFFLKDWHVDRIEALSYGKYSVVFGSYATRKYFIVDRQSGELIFAPSESSVEIYGAGEYGVNDTILSHDTGGSCFLSHYGASRKYASKIFQTPFRNCSVAGHGSPPTLSLTDNSTNIVYMYDLKKLSNNPNQFVDQSARSATVKSKCAHLYVGRVFKGPGGVLKITQEYEVLGFSAATQKATIKSASGDYRQEVDCIDIPE